MLEIKTDSKEKDCSITLDMSDPAIFDEFLIVVDAFLNEIVAERHKKPHEYVERIIDVCESFMCGELSDIDYDLEKTEVDALMLKTLEELCKKQKGIE